MAETDIHMTAMATPPFGLPEFLPMRFGLRNPIQTIQRFIDEELHGLGFYTKTFYSLTFLSTVPDKFAIAKLVTDRIDWPSSHKDIADWPKTGQACQRSDVNGHTETFHETFPLLDSRIDHVHVDTFGPLLLSNGFTYLLTCVNRFLWCQDAFPLHDLATETVVKTLLEIRIAGFGVLSAITTDRGTQFESHISSELTNS
ncbi:unnamed protein product, partial [Hymenolepis diminuta]|uniref:Integrase catalytic domain-containing protein n=1 Tax=Hymenolepis diminuta TaxID=6216 RepID=A0A0R3SNM0_HYMDI